MHRQKGRAYNRCLCTWWVDGTIDGKRYVKSLGTRNRDVARAMMREIEETEIETDAEIEKKQQIVAEISYPEQVTVGDACDRFVADGKARNLSDQTLYKLRLLVHRFKTFADQNDLRLVKELNVDALRRFRAQWPHRGASANKRLEELRAFCRFCCESDRGCAHRFRHTLAKRCLLIGIPPERVAILMGHKSSAVTLKYYANWVRERQEQLEADVRQLQAKFARYPHCEDPHVT
jgi:hypothetical protein